MKAINKSMICLIIAITALNTVSAQGQRDKKSERIADIKNKIESKNYTFLANFVYPQRGGSKALNSEYDLRVKKDTVIAFLPYFGQVHFDVPYNPNEGGIKFTSTKFDYTIDHKKKGSWRIIIYPKDAKNISQLTMQVSDDGYASLYVNCNNRDPISYNGYIK